MFGPGAFGEQSIGEDRGFTAADLVQLGEVQAAALARRLWRRGEFVADGFAHYLAAWTGEAASGPPLLVLARFRRTGTYALTLGTTVVANGRRLADVLPALRHCLDGPPCPL
jgi:hypothetical protein